MWGEVALTVALGVVILMLACCIPVALDDGDASPAERGFGVGLCVVLILALAFAIVEVWS